MATANRYVIGVDQIAVEEYTDRCGSAAHVDHGHAEPDLVLDQAGQPSGIRANDQSIEFEMRTPNCRHVTADAGGVGGHHVHIDAKPVAKHPARVADAAAVIDREPDRHGVDDMAIARFANQMPLLEHPLHLGIGDLPASNADFGLYKA